MKLLQHLKHILSNRPLCTRYPSLVIITAIFIFVFLGFINSLVFSGVRLDLTATHSYTLSAGTKHIVSSLEEPVRIHFFYSRKLAATIPLVQSYANRITELLKNYASLSKHHLTLEIIDPDPFSREEDQAVSLGIQPIPLSDNGEKLYFGLAISNGAGDIKTIPFLDPQREPFLEYDLTHMTQQLSLSKKPVVGILTSLDFNKAPQNIFSPTEDWSILDKIREQYTLKLLKPDGSPIEKVDMLLVIHPINFDDKTEDAIDQYILSGGKTMIFVDPYLEIPGLKNTRSDLPDLFKHWNIGYNADHVILDGINAVQIPITDAKTSLRRIDKLNWLRLSNAYMNQEDMTTSTLNIIHYVSGGSFTPVDAKDSTQTLSIAPLFSTSDQTMDVKTVNVLDAQALLTDFSPENKTYPLAIHLSGKATSAFPATKGKHRLTKSKDSVHVVIVGDVDMLRDQFWMQKQRAIEDTTSLQIADNASFVINTLDSFAGGNDLIGLRSRSVVDRPFLVVNQLRQRAGAHFLAEEDRLKAELKMTDAKLLALQKNRKDDGSEALSPEQEAEVNAFQQEMIETRAKLRDVQHHLDRRIENLGSILKLIHIGIIPGIVLLLALYLPRRIGIKRRQ